MGINTAHPQRVCKDGTGTAGVGPRTQSLSRPGKGAGDSPLEGTHAELPGVPSARRPEHGWEEGNRVQSSNGATPTAEGRDQAGIFQRLQEAGRPECGERPEMRVATPSGDATSHVGLDRRLGEGNRGRAAPGFTTPSKSGNQVHGCPEEEKNHKDSLVPALGRHWKGRSGLQRPSPLHPSSPRELAWHGHSLGSLHARRGYWERRNSTCSPATGGPQEQPATPLIHCKGAASLSEDCF